MGYWLFDLLSLHVIFTYYYTPSKPHFFSQVPIVCHIACTCQQKKGDMSARAQKTTGEWQHPIHNPR